MQEHLCLPTFSYAQGTSARDVPDWVVSDEFQFGARSIGNHVHPSWFLLSSVGQVAHWRRALLSSLLADAFGLQWSEIRRPTALVDQALSQVFSAPDDAPAFIFATRGWQPFARVIRQQQADSFDRYIEQRDIATARGRHRVTLGLGLGEAPLEVELREGTLAYPTDRPLDEAKFRWILRQRGAYDRAGRELLYSLEENLGLIGPEDVFTGYFPAHAAYALQDATGLPTGTNAYSVLAGRLRPRGTFHSAFVQYLVLALEPETGRLIAINTMQRRFERFLDSTPQVSRLFRRQVLGEASES